MFLLITKAEKTPAHELVTGMQMIIDLEDVDSIEPLPGDADHLSIIYWKKGGTCTIWHSFKELHRALLEAGQLIVPGVTD